MIYEPMRCKSPNCGPGKDATGAQVGTLLNKDTIYLVQDGLTPYKKIATAIRCCVCDTLYDLKLEDNSIDLAGLRRCVSKHKGNSFPIEMIGKKYTQEDISYKPDKFIEPDGPY